MSSCLAVPLKLLDPKDEGTTTVQNVLNHSPSDTVSYPLRLESSWPPCSSCNFTTLVTSYQTTEFNPLALEFPFKF